MAIIFTGKLDGVVTSNVPQFASNHQADTRLQYQVFHRVTTPQAVIHITETDRGIQGLACRIALVYQ